MTTTQDRSHDKIDPAEQRFSELWSSPTGLKGFIATVNNRPIGKRYMVTALIFFSIAVAMALLIRAQLAFPRNDLLGPDAYNGVFTMHGSTMLYLFAVPFIEGLGLYLIPLMIGARDVAFPRLSSFGYWLYLFGGVTMYASFLFGQVPDAGWTAYTPLSGPKYSGLGLDFWLLGLSMVEIAGLGAAVEIVVTILKFRAPGMAIHRMPLIVWAYLIIGVMIIFAFTPLLLGTMLLEMDRSFGTRFFDVDRGGSSLLWQHLFWFFGHPEVYIIFLPATGVVTSVVETFSRRRVVAYKLILAALMITGFVSFGLWSHHMFTAGLPDLPMLFFTAASFMIALASGTQIFAWIATLWGTRPRFSVPFLYVLGFFFIFLNGGFTGVMVATMPFDWQVHDTHFVVAHFHHVLIGGAVFPFLAGLHYWMPKLTGRMFNDRFAKLGFWVAFLGFNITFVPMYFIGAFGMRRRVYTYSEDLGVTDLNLISSLGAILLAFGLATTLLNLLISMRKGRVAPQNPWEAGTLEWSLPSPPPSYGFEKPPVVEDLYPEWKRASLENPLHTISETLKFRPLSWRGTLVTDVTDARPQAVQYLPGPTRIPFVAAVALLAAAVSVLAKTYILALVAALCASGIIARWLYRDPQIAEEEFRELSARLKVPLSSSGSVSAGWWGMLGLIGIIATAYGGLVYAYYYLWLYSESWPQFGLPEPGGLSPVLVTSPLILSLFGVWMSKRGRAATRPGMLSFGLTTTCFFGTLFVLGGILVLARVPFGIDESAYSSIYYILNGFPLLLAIVALGLLGATLRRVLSRKEAFNEARLVLWLQNSELFWLFTALLGVLSYLVTQVSPHLI
ncbi:MAG: hypothetical protein A2428_10215 [Bdellovibrionales bacterium RIFOXYC1_FULL_54_43]|nr:MAG: hypothetical protein A2428_10215 [Bdellovibrionales bacterium RIFOXYC1_FULL_54_43]OFZ80507.1 MAG: hypothetical protein A2603_13040 [Bdellovibrionales bacterium RIFOXYD1_FULL_55_31]